MSNYNINYLLIAAYYFFLNLFEKRYYQYTEGLAYFQHEFTLAL